MLIRIDPASDVALFEQIAGSIRASTITGTLAIGERLPSARDLAEALDINVHTVLRAYQVLRDEGLVDLRPGRGAIVTARVSGDYVALNAAVSTVIAEARKLEIAPSALAALIRETYQ